VIGTTGAPAKRIGRDIRGVRLPENTSNRIS
jgi:hypothetical protein